MKFLDKIKVDHKLRRAKYGNGEREWKEDTFDKPKEVVFLGFRNLSDGVTYRDNWEEIYTFEPKKTFKAMLVCENERTSPFYVKYKEE